MDIHYVNNSKKTAIISYPNINVSQSSTWFNILKRSLGSWKSTPKSKTLTGENNSSNNVRNKEQTTNYFTDEFLDSFNTKSSSKQVSKFSFKSRFKINRNQAPINQPNPVKQMSGEIEKESASIEIILPRVVEAYINETCSEMLQSKMKSVCKRWQNWNRNLLTKPGFKPVHLNTGGNITKTEKLFVPQKTPMLSKNESCTLNFDCQRKDIVFKRVMKVAENLEKSSNLSNKVGENVNLIKSSRDRLSLNRCFETKKQNNKTQGTVKTEVNSIKHSKTSATKGDHSKRNPSQEFKTNGSTIRISQKKSEIVTKNSVNDHDEILQESTKKWSKEILLKCAKEIKLPLKNPLYNEKGRCKEFNISKIVNIDISPSADNDKETNGPFYDKGSSENFVEHCCDDVMPQSFENNNNKMNQIKLRRCVTFLEPNKCSLNLSLRKEWFRSEMDIRMSRDVPDFYKTKSEELHDCVSSNTLTPVQHDTNSGGFNPHHSLNLYKTQTSDFQGDLEKDRFDLELEENCNSKDDLILSGDDQIDDVVPILVSLHSAPSSSDENTEKDDEILQDKSIGDITEDLVNDELINDTNLCQDVEDKNVILDLSAICQHSETTVKVCQRSSQNYSIIEIVNKKKSRGDEGTFHCKKLIERCSERNKISRNKSVNSLLKSSMDDTDTILGNEKLESQVLTYPTIVQQEILVSEDDSNVQEKPKFSALSQMKIANFSSSSFREETGSNLAQKHMSSSYLFIPYNFMKDDHLSGNNIHLLPVPVQVVSDKNMVTFTEKPIQNSQTHTLLEHTVSSKQKCRFKAPYVANRLRYPMNFSKSVSKV